MGSLYRHRILCIDRTDSTEGAQKAVGEARV